MDMNRSLLAKLEFFVAERNIRRSVLLAATNTKNSQSQGLQDLSGVLNLQGSGDNQKQVTVLPNNVATVIRVSGPTLLTVGFGLTEWDSVTFTISSILFLTTPVGYLTLTNESLDNKVNYRVIQI